MAHDIGMDRWIDGQTEKVKKKCPTQKYSVKINILLVPVS